MTDNELIIYQAKRIAVLQTSLDYWSHRCYEIEDKNTPPEEYSHDK